MSAKDQRLASPGKNVNSGVDTVLRLVVFSAFEERVRDYHRIRVLQVGRRCEVVESLKSWGKTSRGVYRKVVNGLRRIAENRDLPRLKSIKRVGSGKRIVQIGGGNARLYCFSDTDEGYTIVCVGTFWVGKGDKRTMQNQAIRQAEELMARWRDATPVAGKPDTRLEIRRTGQ